MGTFDLWGLSLRHPRTRGRKETMTGVGGWSHFWRQGGKPSMKVGPPLGREGGRECTVGQGDPGDSHAHTLAIRLREDSCSARREGPGAETVP